MPVLQDVEKEGQEMFLLRKQDLMGCTLVPFFFSASLKHEKITMKSL